MSIELDFKSLRDVDAAKAWETSNALMETKSLDEMAEALFRGITSLCPYDGIVLYSLSHTAGAPVENSTCSAGFNNIQELMDIYCNYYWRLDPTTDFPKNVFLRITDLIAESKWINSELYNDYVIPHIGGSLGVINNIAVMGKPVAQVVLFRKLGNVSMVSEREKAAVNLLTPAITSAMLPIGWKESFYSAASSDGNGANIISDKLSSRESEIVRLVTEGISNKEIGERLYISELTVKTHMTRILRKTGTRNRVELLAMAMRPPKGEADGD